MIRGAASRCCPARFPAEQVLEHRPDGIFLSNGPGDPEPLDYAIRTIQGLLGRVPIFGICLGHQLLSLACGSKTFKLKFGHRGANQPVLNLDNGCVEITAQNHGFAVDEASLPSAPRGDTPQPERSNDRRGAPSRAAGIQRAISPGSVVGTARQQLSLQALSRDAVTRRTVKTRRPARPGPAPDRAALLRPGSAARRAAHDERIVRAIRQPASVQRPT